jgi:hypothetical protein
MLNELKREIAIQENEEIQKNILKNVILDEDVEESLFDDKEQEYDEKDDNYDYNESFSEDSDPFTIDEEDNGEENDSSNIEESLDDDFYFEDEV